MKKKNVVVSLSGGMDSSTLLLRCLSEYDSCIAISFDYGQKHRVELERAQSLINYINDNPARIFHHDHAPGGFEEIYPKVKYQVIKLEGLADLLNSTLVVGGGEVPEGHYADDNMKETVVPNRNKIFSSITQAIALSIANQTKETCDIALGVHSGDHQIYPDCTEAFRDADNHAFKIGNWNAERVGYFTPYMEGNKFTILQDGELLCEELRLNFNEVYSRTNTSYKPYPNGNSDYKSASSVERIEAFIKLNRPDPITYEDENGIAPWDKVVTYVKQILTNFNK
jgi:7-cyano-7-deazaguanine synthase